MLNFRFMENSGYDYTCLLPTTKVELIEKNPNYKFLKRKVVRANIPVTNKGNSKIVIELPQQIDEDMAKSPFYVVMTDSQLLQKSFYNSIVQIEAEKDKIIITHQYKNDLTESVPLTLIFEVGVT